MKRGRAVVVSLTLASALALLAPVGAGAVDSDLKFAYAFKLDASNGYSIIALAANERADGRGEILLFVSRKKESAIYTAPALLTATSLKATLGALGRVSLEVTRSGVEKKPRLGPGCGDKEDSASYEPLSFSGNFEFRGEEGYTEISSTAPPEFTRFFYDLFCLDIAGETSGRHLPGARLRARSLGGGPRFELQANKNRPGLTVDLPGRSDLPLTGPDTKASLVPACLSEGKGPLRC